MLKNSCLVIVYLTTLAFFIVWYGRELIKIQKNNHFFQRASCQFNIRVSDKID